MAGYCEVENSLFGGHFSLGFAFLTVVLQVVSFYNGDSCNICTIFMEALDSAEKFPTCHLSKGNSHFLLTRGMRGQRIDCKQSLFYLKVCGKGPKTNEYISVTVSVTLTRHE